MKTATIENTNIGDTVVVPINGEFGHEELICVEYEVVRALKAKVKPSEQIVGTNQEPLPEYLPFKEMAYLKEF